MIWPQNFDYHVIKYNGQNLKLKYDRDPPISTLSYWYNFLGMPNWETSNVPVKIQWVRDSVIQKIYSITVFLFILWGPWKVFMHLWVNFLVFQRYQNKQTFLTRDLSPWKRLGSCGRMTLLLPVSTSPPVIFSSPPFVTPSTVDGVSKSTNTGWFYFLLSYGPIMSNIKKFWSIWTPLVNTIDWRPWKTLHMIESLLVKKGSSKPEKYISTCLKDLGHFQHQTAYRKII